MNCPACGFCILSPQQRWQAKMRAEGRCTGCGKPLEAVDLVPAKPDGRKPHRCRQCRVKHAVRNRTSDPAAADADKSES